MIMHVTHGFGHIVNHNSGLGVTIIHRRQTPEAFLSSCVPDLELDNLVLCICIKSPSQPSNPFVLVERTHRDGNAGSGKQRLQEYESKVRAIFLEP